MLKLFVISVTVAVTLAVGGWRAMDAKDAHVDDLLDFAAEKLNAMSNSIMASRATKVTKVEKQLVNGMNYKIEFVWSMTMCNKYSTAEQLSVCDVYADRDQVCSVRIYESFSGDKQLNHYNCAAKQSRRALGEARGCAGCVSDKVKDPDSYMSLYIRAFGIADTNLDVNNVEILSVRTQVVAGTRYIMKVKTSEAGQPRICDVSFVVQPWMTPDVKYVKFDCKPSN